jgi:excisionase family DNA binding protein
MPPRSAPVPRLAALVPSPPALAPAAPATRPAFPATVPAARATVPALPAGVPVLPALVPAAPAIVPDTAATPPPIAAPVPPIPATVPPIPAHEPSPRAHALTQSPRAPTARHAPPRSRPRFRLFPTDLTNVLACPHMTALERLAAHGLARRPHYDDPMLELLRERGLAHESAYVAHLAAAASETFPRALVIFAIAASSVSISEGAVQTEVQTGAATPAFTRVPPARDSPTFLLAERRGFEPLESLHPHLISNQFAGLRAVARRSTCAGLAARHDQPTRARPVWRPIELFTRWLTSAAGPMASHDASNPPDIAVAQPRRVTVTRRARPISKGHREGARLMSEKVQLGRYRRSAEARREPLGGPAPVDPALTREAQRELAGAALLAAIDRYLKVVIAERATADEWVDQETSPLGRRAYLKAVRRGDLKATKVGRRVLVRRSDLDAFFQRCPSRRPPPGPVSTEARTPEEVAASVLTNLGFRARAS